MDDNNKIAIVLGATGLVGQNVVENLMLSSKYDQIRIFGRRRSKFVSSKIKEYITDFYDDVFEKNSAGAHEIYSCLGTTIKKSGTTENMKLVDYDLVLKTATIANQNGVKKIAVVSSIGADSGSKNYYLKIKGEMENALLKIPFDRHAIVRPSLLFGERDEFRFGEIMGKSLIRPLGFLLTGNFKKYRGIDASKVAGAMIYILNNPTEQKIFLSDQLHILGELPY